MEEEPRIADCYTLAKTKSIIVAPFFISDGLHSFEDIPVMLGAPKSVVQERMKLGQPTWRNPTELARQTGLVLREHWERAASGGRHPRTGQGSGRQRRLEILEIASHRDFDATVAFERQRGGGDRVAIGVAVAVGGGRRCGGTGRALKFRGAGGARARGGGEMFAGAGDELEQFADGLASWIRPGALSSSEAAALSSALAALD